MHHDQLKGAQAELAEAQRALEATRRRRIEAEIAEADAAAEAAEACKPRVPAAIAAAARLPAPKARESKQEAAAREHRERAATLRSQLDPPRPGHATSTFRESERRAEQERERWTSRESDPPWMDQAEREAARRVRTAQDAEREAVQRTDEAMARGAIIQP